MQCIRAQPQNRAPAFVTETVSFKVQEQENETTQNSGPKATDLFQLLLCHMKRQILLH